MIVRRANGSEQWDRKFRLHQDTAGERLGHGCKGMHKSLCGLDLRHISKRGYDFRCMSQLRYPTIRPMTRTTGMEFDRG